MLKHIEAGGSGIASDIVTSNDNDKQQREQQAWNEYNLNTLLKKRLNEFVQVASSVDLRQRREARGERANL